MNLNTKIKNKEIKVFIAGCGYTGYPLAKLISKNRIKVVGYDIDKDLIKKLNSLEIKNPYIKFTDKISSLA